MFCGNCGAEIPDGSRFCNHCGAKVIDETITRDGKESLRTNEGRIEYEQEK